MITALESKISSPPIVSSTTASNVAADSTVLSQHLFKEEDKWTIRQLIAFSQAATIVTDGRSGANLIKNIIDENSSLELTVDAEPTALRLARDLHFTPDAIKEGIKAAHGVHRIRKSGFKTFRKFQDVGDQTLSIAGFRIQASSLLTPLLAGGIASFIGTIIARSAEMNSPVMLCCAGACVGLLLLHRGIEQLAKQRKSMSHIFDRI